MEWLRPLAFGRPQGDLKLKIVFHALVIITLCGCWAIANAAKSDNSNNCETWPTDSRDLFTVLEKRVVDAASRAALSVEAGGKQLEDIVAENAEFDLGAGDVGRPLGKGASGLRRLMGEILADRYRFDGWDYMSRKENPCDVHEVTVEFSSRKLGHRAEVKFKFKGGRIVEGKGWLRSMTTGVFPATRIDRLRLPTRLKTL